MHRHLICRREVHNSSLAAFYESYTDSSECYCERIALTKVSRKVIKPLRTRRALGRIKRINTQARTHNGGRGYYAKRIIAVFVGPGSINGVDLLYVKTRQGRRQIKFAFECRTCLPT